MNIVWTNLNKTMQTQLKKKDSFSDGINTLLELRNILMKEIFNFKNLSKDKLCSMPFINAKGYHCKTIAYSIYHIFRIEDIVVHNLICHDEEIFLKYDYKNKMNSHIITTGNELYKQEIADFSCKLNIDELFSYASEVYNSTNKVLKELAFDDLKKTFNEEDKKHLNSLNVVNESANWLIDYWCSKNIKGLLQMPLSRHWIMHIEACLRIKEKLK